MARNRDRARGKKASSISVDMQGVEKRKLVAEGSYAVRVDEVTKETGQDSGKDYLSWVLEITKGKFKGSKLWYNTSLQANALWNLRGMLEAVGMDVPDGVMDIDLKELADQELGVTVERGSYDGKPKAEIVDVFPLDELKDRQSEEEDDEASDDDDEPKGRRRRNKDEDDEDEDDSKSRRRRRKDDDDENEDEDEPKSRRRKKDDDDEDEEKDEDEDDNKSRRRRKKDDDDEDGDDEDEKPARKKGGKKKGGVAEDEVTGADEDSLADIIKEHELDVDLDDHSNLRKKRNAVIAALEDAGLLES